MPENEKYQAIHLTLKDQQGVERTSFWVGKVQIFQGDSVIKMQVTPPMDLPGDLSWDQIKERMAPPVPRADSDDDGEPD